MADGDTQQTGFVLEYMTVPVVDDSLTTPTYIEDMINYIQTKVWST